MSYYAIETRYYTTANGAGRIRATWDRERLSIGYPSGVSSGEQAHAVAATALVVRHSAEGGARFRLAGSGTLTRDRCVFLVELDGDFGTADPS